MPEITFLPSTNIAYISFKHALVFLVLWLFFFFPSKTGHDFSTVKSASKSVLACAISLNSFRVTNFVVTCY